MEDKHLTIDEVEDAYKIPVATGAHVVRIRGRSGSSTLTNSGVAAGTAQLFLVGAIICAIAFVFSLFLIEEPLEERPMGPRDED